MSSVSVLVLASILLTAVASPLHDPVFRPLPIGSVTATPGGWLDTQLNLQTQGLFGHLSFFWPNVADSAWIGGKEDPGLHEDTPYWLNGMVPLAFLNRNQPQPNTTTTSSSSSPLDEVVCTQGKDLYGNDMPNMPFLVDTIEQCYSNCTANDGCKAYVVASCDPPKPGPMDCWLKHVPPTTTTQEECRCLGLPGPHPPLPPVDLFPIVTSYIDYILDHQQPDGWLGPNDTTDGNQYWGPMNVLQAMSMYAEGEPSRKAELGEAMVRHMMAAKGRMQILPLSDWAASRWMDMELSVQWLVETFHDNSTLVDEMLELGNMLHSQGRDWEEWFSTLSGGDTQSVHGVNNAQALKSAAVWYRQSGNTTLLDLNVQRMANMDAKHGLPTGLFCADELLCDEPENKFPSRGSELCAVVESMFSYETMFSVQGHVPFADRVERIAFNGLPATWASPRGGDMWAHQYLQATNEVYAQIQDDHVWPNDGADSEMYGLQPNYVCCTANGPQGWPKFASKGLFFTTADGDYAVGAFAPASATFPDDAVVEIDTEYPYGDVVTVKVTNALGGNNILVRVPSWATKATVNGNPVENGTMVAVPVMEGATTVTIDLNPEVRLESWYNTTVSVFRGPLLFSSVIQPNYTVHNTYDFHSADYELQPTSEWRYALDVDLSKPLSDSLVFNGGSLKPGAAPFNHTGWPFTIKTSARVVESWALAHGSAGIPPPSPACGNGTSSSGCRPPVSLLLVPHGGTDLRIGAFPVASSSPSQDGAVSDTRMRA